MSGFGFRVDDLRPRDLRTDIHDARIDLSQAVINSA